MANTLANAVPEILEGPVLEVLREQSIMPRLVDRDIADVSGKQGDSVKVPIAAAGTVRSVTAGVTHTNIDTTATAVTVTLNQWKESGHQLTDKEMEEIVEGYLPAQAKEDLKALINTVDKFIHDTLRKATYFHTGVAGTTPFSTNLAAFKNARTKLNSSAAPVDDRRVVLDPDAEGNALILAQFLEADKRGDQGGILNGQIGRKLGSDWFMSQNTRTHTSGSLSDVATVLTDGAAAAGASTLVFDRATLTGILLTGDLFSVGGQDFVVTADATASGNAITVFVSPDLPSAIASNQAVTFSALSVSDTWVDNLHFQKNALAFATRPLAQSAVSELGSVFGTVVDPISGLVIRLEMQRQNRQTSMMFDILYGATAVRPELSVRILG